MLSCVSETRKVVEAIRLGAQDYLTKPFKRGDLQAALGALPGGAPRRLPSRRPRKLREKPLNLNGLRGRQSRDGTDSRPGIAVGQSGCFRPAPGRKRHRQGSAGSIDPPIQRAGPPPVPENQLRALPDDLMESELFGYEAGAFTGANKNQAG